MLPKPSAKCEGLPASQGSPTRAFSSSKRLYAFAADETTWAFTEARCVEHTGKARSASPLGALWIVGRSLHRPCTNMPHLARWSGTHTNSDTPVGMAFSSV